MHQPGRVHGLQCKRKRFDQFQHRFQPGERLTILLMVSGIAADQIRPQPRTAIVHGSAVNSQYVSMAHQGKLPGLVQEQLRLKRAALIRLQEFERDVPVQRPIVGPVNVTETAVTQQLQHLEMTPLEQHTARIRSRRVTTLTAMKQK